jgi:hypothetical protein
MWSNVEEMLRIDFFFSGSRIAAKKIEQDCNLLPIYEYIQAPSKLVAAVIIRKMFVMLTEMFGVLVMLIEILVDS